MYNINQLNAMSDEQLRELAKSMGIRRADSANHDDLVYEVLDHQAEIEAANAPEPTRRRRERIRQPAAKANGNEVVKDDAIVTNDKKAKEDKPMDLPRHEDKTEEVNKQTEQSVEKNLDAPEVTETPKRKRGRPSAAEKAVREAVRRRCSLWRCLGLSGTPYESDAVINFSKRK